MQAKKAFSFVEIIIVISIIALLAVVWMSYQWAQNQNTKNTKAIWDLGTLNNSLLSYMEVEKTLPLPKWNKNYFTKTAEYSHDETWAYWVHGFVTQDLLPNKYLNYLPLDPRTNQYYAYWKTLDNNFYEVAWVLKENWEYVSKVQWNYPADNWPYSLIREYNWADFVSDDSKVSFPYNPEERVLVAKINNASWSVTISWDWYMISGTQILSHTLVQWDTITVPANWTATIFFSDWSQSVLWEASQISKLELKEMIFKEEDNLLTRVNLFLESGTLWTKATRLNQEDWGSDFEVYTDDTTAAVRWTIFWIRDNWANTSVTVIKWEVDVNPNWATIQTIREWHSFNSTITQPDFTIITKLPHNTITWAVLENTGLAEEYAEKNPDVQVTFLTWATTPSCNWVEVWTDCYNLYASAEYNDAENMTNLNINSKFLLLETTNWNILASSFFPSWDWSVPYASSYPWDIQWDDVIWHPFDGVTWVFINNVGNDDYVSYSWLSISLNYAIEMKVLWKDLKWNTSSRPINPFSTPNSYTLFQSDNNTNNLKLNSSWLNFWTFPYSTIGNSLLSNTLNDYSFYIVQAICEDWNATLKIKDTGLIWTSWTCDWFTELYIWSTASSLLQWNWIIDYVKIYKKID